MSEEKSRDTDLVPLDPETHEPIAKSKREAHLKKERDAYRETQDPDYQDRIIREQTKDSDKGGKKK